MQFKKFLDNQNTIRFDSIIEEIKSILSSFNLQKTTCTIDENIVSEESSSYSKELNKLTNPSFDSIRNIAYNYLQSIGDPEELFYRLQRGEAIIDDEKLLYKYLVAFGGKHKVKLYSAYDQLISKLTNVKFNIIDWGCGQATATMLLLDYARQKNIELNIENITLIEPSKLALSRGLLHIDTLKQKNYKINIINSDLDCLDEKDLLINNEFLNLHLFSNILDLETFTLDDSFFEKVSKYIDNESIFLCISPNRNDKLNNRIETFYNYFSGKFQTSLISSRSDSIDNATRYEKIFTCKPNVVEVEVVEESNLAIIQQKEHHIDIIKELTIFENYVTPILNMDLLENSINVDPEYAIFKTRKVAEIITSNIYSRYEDNAKQVSFNDKIRYLAYEKSI